MARTARTALGAWLRQKLARPFDPERRRLLEASAAAGALLAFPACKDDVPDDDDPKDDTVDSEPDTDLHTDTVPVDTDAAKPDEHVQVAVIGAGLAGLLAAARLDEAGVQVVVFEALDRVGGRTFSGRDLFEDRQIVELGGELMDSNHVTLAALAEELGLALDDRTAAPAVHEPTTLWLNGRRWDLPELIPQLEAAIPIVNAALDSTSDPAELARLDGMSLAAWLGENLPASETPELHQIMRLVARNEFGVEPEAQSALNLLLFLDTDDLAAGSWWTSDERFHCHAGNDSFCSNLVLRLPANSVRLQHTLTAVAQDLQRVTLRFDSADGSRTISCDQVLLTLPFTALRRVDLSQAALSTPKRTAIDTLGYGTHAKIMGGFTNRAWRVGYSAGGSVTSDRPFQQTWDSSLGQPGDSGVLTCFVGGQTGATAGAGTAEAWFDDALVDLDAVFPGLATLSTGKAARMAWTDAPGFWGSYGCYTPGQWAWAGIEGVPEGRVFFAGEHCSVDFQGWMEGAAETGVVAAAAILDDRAVAAGPRLRSELRRLRRRPHAALTRRRVTWHERRRR